MDARTTAQFTLELPATVTTTDTEVTGTVESLSLGGVFIRGAHLPIDTHAVLRFTLPKRADLEIPCTARWSTADGTGLQFNGLRAADTYALTRYIRAQGAETTRTPIDQILRSLPPR